MATADCAADDGYPVKLQIKVQNCVVYFAIVFGFDVLSGMCSFCHVIRGVTKQTLRCETADAIAMYRNRISSRAERANDEEGTIS